MQRYLVLSGEGAILRFFTGRGDTFTDGGDIWRGGVAKYRPIGAGVGEWNPKKLKILINFYQILRYKRITSAHPLHDFYKICGDCGGDSVKKFQSYGGFNLWGLLTLKF